MANSSASRMTMSNVTTILCLFWLFSSTALAASAVLGIDFGTEYIKAALVKPGIPLEIVLTKDSRRKETSAVAFKPIKNAQSGSFPERIYGSDAVALSARFPGDVYPNLKALLGLTAENSKVSDYITRHPALKLEKETTRGTAAFKSGAFSADEDAWMVEEILAMELQSIQKNAEALAGKGSSIYDIVITVPPYFSLEEKRAIELAADLAGLRVLSLISDGLAVGLNYATTRTFPSISEGGNPEHHLIFDMGAGSTKATVLKFQGRTVKDVGRFNKTVQEVSVLGTGWDRTLGGDALNAIIVDDMIESFVGSKAAKAASITSESVQNHGRAAAKLWKEAERLRQVLSANAETQASFEGLYDEVDFKYKISRATFEKLAESFAERVFPAIETALDAAKLEITDLDSIILHGGAVRTPFIQKQLESIVGKADKIRSNVNADEAAVFGAAFKGAGLSPSFRVKEIRTSEAAGYAVGMKWRNIHEKPQHQRLYLPQSHLGVEKVVSFQNQEDFPITFYQHVGSSENVSPGSAEKEVMILTTKNLTLSVAELKEKHGCTDGDILLKFGVRLNGDHGEVEITKGALQCEVEEDDKKGGVVDGVKGLFGFGGKKSDQDVFKDADIVADVTSETSSTTSKTSSSSSSTGSASASASASAKDEKPKSTKRLVAIPIDFSIERKGYTALSPQDLIKKKDRLVAFDDSDRSRRLREESLNQLEGFTYRVRDLIDDESFIAASTDAERASLDTKSKAASEWLYGEGADATREELREKLKELKDIVTPVEKRRDESSKRPEQVMLLKEALNQTMSFINTVRSQMEKAAEVVSLASSETSSTTTTTSSTTEDDFAGLEDDESTTSSSSTSSITASPTPPAPMYIAEDLEPVIALYESTTAWLAEKMAEQDKLPATADPVILVKEIAARAQELNKVGMDLIMKAMKPPEMPKKSFNSKTSKSKKSKTPKTKKATATTANKSASSDQTKPSASSEEESDQPVPNTPGFDPEDDGSPLSEEEILAFMKKQKKPTQQDWMERANKAKEKAEKKKEEAESHIVDEL